MTTHIIEYYDNIELPDYYKYKKLMKFKGFKNNGKVEGPCIIGYVKWFYYYEEINFIDNKKKWSL